MKNRRSALEAVGGDLVALVSCFLWQSVMGAPVYVGAASLPVIFVYNSKTMEA